jgi:hypothetical protein
MTFSYMTGMSLGQTDPDGTVFAILALPARTLNDVLS